MAHQKCDGRAGPFLEFQDRVWRRSGTAGGGGGGQKWCRIAQKPRHAKFDYRICLRTRIGCKTSPNLEATNICGKERILDMVQVFS